MFPRLSNCDFVTVRSLIDFAASRPVLLVAAPRVTTRIAAAARLLSTRAQDAGWVVTLHLLAALILAPTLPCVAQERGYLGVDLRDLTIERARELRLDPAGGVLIVNPRRNSPAEQAGLLANDVILSLDDVPVRNKDAAIEYIGARPPGTTLKISIWRSGERREVSATVGRFPEALALVQQIQALTNQRRYTEAIPLAERLVEVTEANSGPLSADYASGLDR